MGIHAFVVNALVLGLVVGCFLNVLASRLPKRLEHYWRLQAREILGLSIDTQKPVNHPLSHTQCPHGIHPNIPRRSYADTPGNDNQSTGSVCNGKFCAHPSLDKTTADEFYWAMQQPQAVAA